MRRYLSYSVTQRPILRFFAPHGQHVALMGVKFGMEEGTACQISMPNFDKGIGPPKLKFLLRFDHNVEYERPAGVYPLAQFSRILQNFEQVLGCISF